eukprot:TRINITY_DN2455_c0_g1_i6.p1 TRINITY_DN2455_c0_g1~~TRINITY_DN2455_c0_g1_i6.p1  ORF type:complete len:1291 (+),score=92.88 TRINITY_DN2455_c0_g1_i6:504-4376(+)
MDGQIPTRSLSEAETVRILLVTEGNVEVNPGPPGDSKLKVLSWNCRSLNHKGSYINHILGTYSPDVLCLQETWIKKPFRHWNYITYSQARSGRGGGVITLVKRQIDQKRILVPVPTVKGDVESLCVRINNDVDVFNIYAPPQSEIDTSNFVVPPKCILAGDFNAHSSRWSTKTDKKGLSLRQWANRNQLLVSNEVKSITRPGQQTSPDVVFYSDSIILDKFMLLDDNQHNSDHLPLLVTYDTLRTISANDNHASKRVVWDFDTTDWSKFRYDLDKRLRKMNRSQGVIKKAKVFSKILLETAKKHTRRRLLIRGRTKKRWKGSKSTTLQNKGNYLADQLDKGSGFAHAFRVVKDLGSNGHHEVNLPGIDEKDLPEVFLEQFMKKETPRELRLPDPYEPASDLDDEICSPLRMIELKRAIKLLKKGKAPGPDGIHGVIIKNLTDKGMEVLLEIMNESWMSALVPQSWKEGRIKPILKPGKPHTSTASYRPITLTSTVGKLCERIIFDRLMHWLTVNKSLSCTQAGFRRGRNTCEQITLLVNAICEARMENKRSVLLSFDFTAAFDKIDHQKLIDKMAALKIPSRFVKWVIGFLRKRSSRVEVNGCLSSYRTMTRGVPQGSIMGPLLYLLYVDDLAKKLEGAGATSALYADDTACIATGADLEEAAGNAQRLLDIVDWWCKDNDMQLSLSKTSGMIIGSASGFTPRLTFPRTIKENWYLTNRGSVNEILHPDAGDKPTFRSGETVLEVNGNPIRSKEDLLNSLPNNPEPTSTRLKTGVLLPFVDTVKYLGVFIDADMSFFSQFEKVRKELKKGIALLKAVKPYSFNFRTLQMIKNLYIVSRVSYGLEAYGWRLKETDKETLDVEIKEIARLITGCGRCTHTRPLLWEAKMLTMNQMVVKQTRTALYRYRTLDWVPQTKSIADGIWGKLLNYEDAGRDHLGVVQPDSMKPWDDVPNLTISSGFGYRKSGDAELDKVRFGRYCNTLAPAKKTFYIDGSFNPLTREAGAAVVATNGNSLQKTAIKLKGVDNSYEAEQAALLLITDSLVEKPYEGPIRIFTDSKSNLDELDAGLPLQRKLYSLKILSNIKKLRSMVHLQFIPAHVNIWEHDQADELAKRASTSQLFDSRRVRKDFYSLKSKVSREANRENILLIAERLRNRRKNGKKLCPNEWGRLSQYLAVTRGKPVARYPKGMTREDEIRIAQFRSGTHNLITDWGKSIPCPFCKRELSSQSHLLLQCKQPLLGQARVKAFGEIVEYAAIMNKPLNVALLFQEPNLGTLAGYIRWLERRNLSDSC